MRADLTRPRKHSGQPPTSRAAASLENRLLDTATIIANADAQLAGIVVDLRFASLCVGVLKAVSDRFTTDSV
jgi:hypothetical protein